MVQLDNIVKTYNKGKSNAFEALHGISLTIEDGEMVAIIGTSGAGKSTLLHILACIDGYDSGEYRIDDMTIGKISERKMAAIRNEKIGMVMQDFALIEEFTALDNVMIPLDFAARGKKKRKKDRKEIARKMLEMVQMQDFVDKPVSNLSGGQKQRVAIAGVIAMEPEVIVLDEPTAMLDPKGRAEVISTVTKLCREKGITVVLITHHMSECIGADRVIVMSNGNVIADDSPENVFSQVELMKSEGLTVPATTELMFELNKNGWDLPLTALGVSECAKEIAKELK